LGTQKGKQALLFLQKKTQKNFDFLKLVTPAVAAPAVNKSFFASFFAKKEALSFLSKNTPQSRPRCQRRASLIIPTRFRPSKGS
jgi:hypothetical protein